VSRAVLAIALGLSLTAIGAGPLVETLAAHVGHERPGVVSFELADAPAAPTAQARVALWLARHAPDLDRAEQRFGIDRRAIAAAIAYEALADPRTGAYGYAARFSGPGKVHYRELRFSEGDPSAKQVEDLGLMPHLDMLSRRAALERPAVAIGYIAAIMSAFVRDDPAHAAAMRCADARLVTLYTAWKPSDFAGRSVAGVADNAAGEWTTRHAGYLAAALGAPPAELCSAS
jgi:hypothetical protein